MTGADRSSAGPRRTIFDSRPSWWLRPLFAAPRLLYRLGLGRLLGHRFLELEHRGRRTGRVHRTVLEVVGYDPARRESTVVAAWGVRSDWYQNVLAGLAVCVRTSADRYVPEHRVLAPDEARAALADYERRNGSGVGPLRALFGLAPEEPFTALAERMPLVALRPRAGETV